MNKTQLHYLLVAILVAMLGFAWAHARGHRRAYVLAHAHTIGKELIATTNSTQVVHLESSLRSRLAELRRSPARVDRVTMGDDPVVGDGRADAIVVISNQNGLRLGIRIQQAEGERFHVLGFWTLAEPVAVSEQARRRQSMGSPFD